MGGFEATRQMLTVLWEGYFHCVFCRYRLRIWDSLYRLVAGRFGVWISAVPREFFLFSETSRPALGPAQFPVQLTLVFFHGGITIGAWIWPHLSSDEVKNGHNNTFAPLLCFRVVGGDIFTFLPHNIGQFVTRTKGCTGTIYTVIPRLTKIIRSGITFVSRNLR